LVEVPAAPTNQTSLAVFCGRIIFSYPRSINSMEDKMAVLKSLTFTTIPTPGGNPVLDRRSKIIARLEEQKLILKDPNYTRTVRHWVKKDGERVMVEKQQRVPLWWRQNEQLMHITLRGLQRIKGRRRKVAVPSVVLPLTRVLARVQAICLHRDSRSFNQQPMPDIDPRGHLSLDEKGRSCGSGKKYRKCCGPN
jgi:hypothetical protein